MATQRKMFVKYFFTKHIQNVGSTEDRLKYRDLFSLTTDYDPNCFD